MDFLNKFLDEIQEVSKIKAIGKKLMRPSKRYRLIKCKKLTNPKARALCIAKLKKEKFYENLNA
jgi:hypothetical protein